ncbi:NADPH-dependent oxidoreductase [Lactiplantibacillus paraplantarum]|uniref:NADPH-dependent oxidoreductase n=2 Tax=Lactiplantibacillus paraplantarum TaxID=60520 RepID=A0AAD0TRN9_9LACO|nr:NADPH-dependent oxidoreductase [Lactiplantibacillus paraplantarum]AYJ39482.1 NADPH-dependent oxidoreductase [Lactiplantibacillus paraplantarum]
MEINNMQKILMVVGSLRKDSFNKTVAEQISTQLVAQGAEVTFANIADLPLINQDIEFPAPSSVMTFREQVQAADGLWIVTPEYNEMIPGGLKNALDWLSRPTEAGVFGAPDFIMNKPVMLTGAGGKKAAKVGLAHLKTLLTFMGLKPNDNLVGLQIPTSAFMTGKFDLDSEQRAVITQQVTEYLA